MDWFSSNISFLIESNDIQSIDLAKIVNSSSGTISNWKRNLSKPRYNEILILLKHFNLTFEQLFQIDLKKLNWSEKQIKLNEVGEPHEEYIIQKIKEVTFYIEKECKLTGGKCAFELVPELRAENEGLRKEIEKLKNKK